MTENEKAIEKLKQSTASLHQARLDLKKADERLMKNFIPKENIFDKHA